MTTIPLDTHEWVSFDDVASDRTWMVDATFIESNWTCIFNNGCQGVLTGPTPELAQGCCSYGAHFTDDADRQRVELAALRLSDEQWQFKSRAKKNGTTKTKKNGESTTRLVDDACIFLNRPGFARGPGCALHVLAMDNGESYIPLKPEVCWQLPLRREDVILDNGHVVTRIAQWDRPDWGDGGAEFHWWCTEDPAAFTGATRVIDSMADELIAIMGDESYAHLLAVINQRAQRGTPLPHPVVRRRP